MDEFIEQFREMVKELENENVRLEARVSELQRQKTDNDEQIRAAYRLLSKYREKHDMQESASPVVNYEALRDKTYKQAMIEFAKQHDGDLRVKEAVQAMLKAGVSEDKDTIMRNIYGNLNHDRGRTFSKINRGFYRLKQVEQQPDNANPVTRDSGM